MSGSKHIGRALALSVKFITAPLGVRKRAKVRIAAGECLADSSAYLGWSVNDYEPDTVEWINGLPDKPFVLWDIGANIGLYSLLAAGQKQCRVIAFEPCAATCHVLNKCIMANQLDDRITALPVALCDETRIDHLNVSSFDPGVGMHGFGIDVDQFGNAIKTKFRQGSIGCSIDDFVRTFKPPLPDYIKIDVDGLEPDIIRGGHETLSAPGVRSVIIEMEGSEARLSELARMMSNLGFAARPKRKAEYRNVVFDRR